MSVRLRHPALDTEITVDRGAVPHHQAAGWRVVEGQQEQGETWPAELQRFEGQQQVRMRHPLVEGEPITVAESAVPFHREKGWQVVEATVPAVETEAAGLEGLTVEELKERARNAGLPVSGTKAELLERLGSAEQEDESPAEPASEEE